MSSTGYPLDANLWRLPDATFVDEMAPPAPPAAHINSTLDHRVLYYHGHSRPHEAQVQARNDQQQRSNHPTSAASEPSERPRLQRPAEKYAYPMFVSPPYPPPTRPPQDVVETETSSNPDVHEPLQAVERDSPPASIYPDLDTDWDAMRRDAAAGCLRRDYRSYAPSKNGNHKAPNVVPNTPHVTAPRPHPPPAAPKIPDALIDPMLLDPRLN